MSEQPRPCRRYTLGLVLCGASCCAFACSPAQAQNVADDAATLRDNNLSGDQHLEEIIVTARRRPELLERTPVSVVALTKQGLEARSVTNLRSLQNFVPNLTFAPSQNVGEAAANVFIRGIGQEDFGVGAEAGVAVYVDGVYFARSLGLMMNLTDIERIEVMRGPQGTLFGKDAIGGAINVVSTLPGAQRERSASLIVGNLSRLELRTIVNEPLSDRLFLRLSAGLVSRDGYLRRLTPLASLDRLEQANGRPANLRREGDNRSQGGRLQLRWVATDTLTFDLSLDATHLRNTQGAIHVDAIDPDFGIFPEINDLIAQGKLPGPAITSELVTRNLLQSYATGDNFTKQDVWGASAVLTKRLGSNTVRFIGAYRGLRSHIGTDDDGLYFDIIGSDLKTRQEQFSAELQLNGTAGRLTYTTGLFAFEETPKILPTTSINDVLYSCGCYYIPGGLPIETADRRRLRTQSLAAYAQGTYRIVGGLSATLGGRYTFERKQLNGQSFVVGPDGRLTTVLVATGHASDDWNSFTYRAGLEYQATSGIMAYGSIASGFKSGGFNVRGDLRLPNMGFTSFDPERALTYELGLHAQWLDNRLRLNAALFETEYKDIQLRQPALIAGEIVNLIENAARARIRGAEADVTAMPLTGLTLTAGYGHLAPKYLDVGQVRGLTLASPFQRTPRDTFSGSINYQVPVPSGTLDLHGDYSYRSKEQFQILAAANDQMGYGLLSARLTFRGREDRWSVALFGTNLTDKRYRTAGRGTLIKQAGFSYSSVGLPRQVGIQLTTRF